MKKLVFVNETIPHTEHGGGGVTAYSIIEGIVNNGIDVFIVVLKGSEDENLRHSRKIEKLGAKVIFLNIKDNIASTSFFSKVKNTLNFSFDSIFPNVKHAVIVKQQLDVISPDFVLAYHWEAASSLYQIQGYIKVAVVGDPIHLPSLFRRSLYRRLDHEMSFKKKLIYWLFDKFLVKEQISGMVKLLNDFNISGAFAAHHASELENFGVSKCRYFHTPVPPVENRELIKKEKFKIVLMGHLIGIATLSGVELFIKEVYPAINEKIGKNNYEVHVVGGFFDTMPEHLKIGLKQDNIILRGQVNPANDEFLSADVVLVPTPIDLGIRVRIISAFSFGSLIVAHIANKSGIPELVHGENSLLGLSGDEIAKHIIGVYNKEFDIHHLREKSYKTYEAQFTPHTFFQELESSLKEVL